MWRILHHRHVLRFTDLREMPSLPDYGGQPVMRTQLVGSKGSFYGVTLDELLNSLKWYKLLLSEPDEDQDTWNHPLNLG